MAKRWLIALCLASTFAGAQERNFRLSSEVAVMQGWLLGTMQPAAEVTLSNEVAGLIDALNVRLGEPFKSGQILVSFDCRLLALQQRKSKSQNDLKAEQLRVNQRLFELNSIGAEEVAIARAEQQSTEVDLEIANYSVERCEILAPFDGVVAEVLASEKEYVERHTPLIRVFKSDVMDVSVNAPLQNVANLTVGDDAEVLYQANEVLKGQVLAVSPEINPISQLIELRIRIDNPPNQLKHGAAVGVRWP